MSEPRQTETGANPDEEAVPAEGVECAEPESAEVIEQDGVESGEDEAGVPKEELDLVAALEAEVGKWKEMALRSQADLDNFRKRMARDRQEGMRYANSGLLEALLPILDNFEMGLEAARAESEESMIFQGMDMVRNQMRGFLEEQGVTEVEAAGKVFDPKMHEAMSQESSAEIPEGEIVKVMRRGYMLRDRLLRAPAVVVSTGPDTGGDVAGEG